MLALLAIRPLSVSVRHLMRRGLPCAVGLFVLSSCTASYEDVSHSPAFAARRGEACALSSDVVAHGIRRELSAAKQTDYVVISPSPGFDGPEVTFREALGSGIVLTIAGARQCTNCIPSSIQFRVTSPSLDAHRQYPIWAQEEVLSPGASVCRKP